MSTIRLALVGPPGAETAHVAKHLATRFGLLRISIREAIQSATRAGSELSDQLRRFMDSEQPPPDELIAALVLRRMSEPDAADGFVFWASVAPWLPLVARSLEPQAIQVIELVLSDAEATRRLTGRRVCWDCGKAWQIESVPTLDVVVCDRCGGHLFQRQDDQPEAVARLLRAYHERSGPVLAHYRADGRLTSINAARPTEHVATELVGHINQRS